MDGNNKMGTTQPRGGFFGKFHRSTGKLNPPYIYLAYNEMWTEMFKELDNCRAGVDDFNQFGFTALHCAAKHGAVGVIDELVRRGASIDAINGKIYINSPMHVAVGCQQTDAAKRLVHHGASLTAKNTEGWVPIQLAQGPTELNTWLTAVQPCRHSVGACNEHFIKFAHGQQWADVYIALDNAHAGVEDYDRAGGVYSDNTLQIGYTVLHWAAIHGALDAIDELIRRGANVNSLNDLDNTPLHHAAGNNQIEAAKLLVHHGAELNARNHLGRSPADTARQGGSHILAKWLKDKTRARRNWAAVSASVNAFQYALFWQEYVCRQNCAPGGKFAKQDRAAFEEEFGH